MKSHLLRNSLLLGALSYIVCILAQGFPLWSTDQPFLLYPADIWSIVECIGFVAGIVGVYLMIVESPWNFPVGLCWAVAYTFFFFFEARHFGEGAVMVVTAGFLVHGWINWTNGFRETSLQITRANKIDYLVLGATVLLGWPAVWWTVSKLQGEVPVVDSLTTVLNLGAQYFTNRKRIESWYVWMVVNVLFIALMYYRGYYPTTLLYTVFLIMAFVGLKEWKTTLGTSKPEAPSAV